MARQGFIGSAIILAIMVIITMGVWLQLPADTPIPVHFDINGEPDRYGSRNEALLGMGILVGTTAFTAILMGLLPKLMPRSANLEKSARVYLIIWMGLLLFMLAILLWVAALFFGVRGSFGIRGVFVLMSLLMLGLGNYLPKVRSNWILGIRTPWTLSSETSWAVTHRIVGQHLVIASMIGILVSLFAPLTWVIPIVLSLTLLPLLGGIIISYFVWRTAPDRQD